MAVRIPGVLETMPEMSRSLCRYTPLGARLTEGIRKVPKLSILWPFVDCGCMFRLFRHANCSRNGDSKAREIGQTDDPQIYALNRGPPKENDHQCATSDYKLLKRSQPVLSCDVIIRTVALKSFPERMSSDLDTTFCCFAA